MQTKKSKRDLSAGKFVGINIILAIVLGIILLLGFIFWLKGYTLHGKEVTVPEVLGLQAEEATIILHSSDLVLDVVDSTYSTSFPLGAIVEQTPPAYSHTKPNRPVYVVVNARSRRMVPLPELHDVSYRQAEATLKSVGLTVGDVVYEPAVYAGNVLDVRSGEISLSAGTRLEEGSSVTLVIGQQQGNRMVVVPSVLGKSLSDTRASLLSTGLTIGAIYYDEEPKDNSAETIAQYIVFQQHPQDGETIQEGSAVTIWMSTSLERAAMNSGEVNEDDFF